MNDYSYINLYWWILKIIFLVKKKKYIEEYIMMFLNIKLRVGKIVWYII